MRDWEEIVRKRFRKDLGKLSRDVISELADHLEDLYEDLRARGVCESEAFKLALADFPDSSMLARRIPKTKCRRELMNERTKQLWLPALVSLTLANVMLMALTRSSLEPRMIASISSSWFPGLSLAARYLPWLTLQPVISGVAAHLSQRAGGSRKMRFTTGLFPSIVMLGCWTFVIPASAIFERNPLIFQHPVYLAAGTLVWVVPAAMASILGTLPCVGFEKCQMALRAAQR